MENFQFALTKGSQKPLLNSGSGRAAFTLAEVLITLAIIGIVAVITLPTIMQNYKKITTEVRLKKFYSSISQAITLSEINNGKVENWTKEDMAYDENGQVDPEKILN